jgi:hypothetical protein
LYAFAAPLKILFCPLDSGTEAIQFLLLDDDGPGVPAESAGEAVDQALFLVHRAGGAGLLVDGAADLDLTARSVEVNPIV